MNRLREIYTSKIVEDLKKELGLKSTMQVPKLKKLVLNAGIGNFKDNREAVELFITELSDITGQRPSYRKARKSESGFKIRQGDIVAYTVTLRGERMWAFLDKFVTVVLPRIRDFKGLSLNSFDKSGNYSVGIREHVIFPEINPNKIKGNRSMQVTFNIDAQNKEHSKALLGKLGIPFVKSV